MGSKDENPLGQIKVLLARPFPDGLTIGEHLLAGFVAQGFSVFAMHPMDTIKTFIQKSTKGNPGEIAKRLNIFSASGEMIKNDGLGSFYRGVGPNVVAQAPAGAIKFAVFEGLSNWADKALFATGKLGSEMKAIADLGCAAVAFTVCSIVLIPGEVIKQGLQAGVYPSIGNALQRIASTEGLRGFYTGWSATLVRDVPYTMLEFGLYHQFKRILKYLLKKDKLSSQEELMMGGLAGGFTGFFTTPLDLAKTKLMTQANLPPADRYSSFMEALVDISRREGVSGCFRGASARVLWLIPFTAIFFGIHEKTKRTILQRKNAIVANAAVTPRARSAASGFQEALFACFPSTPRRNGYSSDLAESFVAGTNRISTQLT